MVFIRAIALTTDGMKEGVVISPLNGPPNRTGPSVSVNRFDRGVRLMISLIPLEKSDGGPSVMK